MKNKDIAHMFFTLITVYFIELMTNVTCIKFIALIVFECSINTIN